MKGTCNRTDIWMSQLAAINIFNLKTCRSHSHTMKISIRCELCDDSFAVSSSGCIVEGREVPHGWNQVFEETSHGSADVAIIIEMDECNAVREMSSLLDHLARQLARKNISE